MRTRITSQKGAALVMALLVIALLLPVILLILNAMTAEMRVARKRAFDVKTDKLADSASNNAINLLAISHTANTYDLPNAVYYKPLFACTTDFISAPGDPDAAKTQALSELLQYFGQTSGPLYDYACQIQNMGFTETKFPGHYSASIMDEAGKLNLNYLDAPDPANGFRPRNDTALLVDFFNELGNVLGTGTFASDTAIISGTQIRDIKDLLSFPEISFQDAALFHTLRKHVTAYSYDTNRISFANILGSTPATPAVSGGAKLRVNLNGSGGRATDLYPSDFDPYVLQEDLSTTACADDTDCATTQACDTALGVCVTDVNHSGVKLDFLSVRYNACSTNAQCQDHMQCSSKLGYCVPKLCKQDQQCGPNAADTWCNTTTGQCEAGCRLGQCATGEFCNTMTRQCELGCNYYAAGDTAKTGDACAALETATSTLNLEYNWFCSEQYYFNNPVIVCNPGASSCGAGAVCVPETDPYGNAYSNKGRCGYKIGEQCKEGCEADSECPQNYICENNTCVDACREAPHDANCSAGYTCRPDVVRSCTDASCASSTLQAAALRCDGSETEPCDYAPGACSNTFCPASASTLTNMYAANTAQTAWCSGSDKACNNANNVCHDTDMGLIFECAGTFYSELADACAACALCSNTPNSQTLKKISKSILKSYLTATGNNVINQINDDIITIVESDFGIVPLASLLADIRVIINTATGGSYSSQTLDNIVAAIEDVLNGGGATGPPGLGGNLPPGLLRAPGLGGNLPPGIVNNCGPGPTNCCEIGGVIINNCDSCSCDAVFDDAAKGCVTNYDCDTANGWYCNSGNYSSSPGVGLTTAGQCVKNYCQKNTDCPLDMDCILLGKQGAINGVDQVYGACAYARCGSDADCAARPDQPQYCNQETQRCEFRAYNTASYTGYDGDICPDTGKPVLQELQCTQTACSADTDCAAADGYACTDVSAMDPALGGPLCCRTMARCAQICTTNTDCPSGAYCDTAAGACIKGCRPGGCDTANGLACNTVTHTCDNSCQSTADCASGFLCDTSTKSCYRNDFGPLGKNPAALAWDALDIDYFTHLGDIITATGADTGFVTGMLTWMRNGFTAAGDTRSAADISAYYLPLQNNDVPAVDHLLDVIQAGVLLNTCMTESAGNTSQWGKSKCFKKLSKVTKKQSGQNFLSVTTGDPWGSPPDQPWVCGTPVCYWDQLEETCVGKTKRWSTGIEYGACCAYTCTPAGCACSSWQQRCLWMKKEPLPLSYLLADGDGDGNACVFSPTPTDGSGGSGSALGHSISVNELKIISDFVTVEADPDTAAYSNIICPSKNCYPGKININTASAEVLEALMAAAGIPAPYPESYASWIVAKRRPSFTSGAPDNFWKASLPGRIGAFSGSPGFPYFSTTAMLLRNSGEDSCYASGDITLNKQGVFCRAHFLKIANYITVRSYTYSINAQGFVTVSPDLVSAPAELDPNDAYSFSNNFIVIDFGNRGATFENSSAKKPPYKYVLRQKTLSDVFYRDFNYLFRSFNVVP